MAARQIIRLKHFIREGVFYQMQKYTQEAGATTTF
jgi:hypothetical protein